MVAVVLSGYHRVEVPLLCLSLAFIGLGIGYALPDRAPPHPPTTAIPLLSPLLRKGGERNVEKKKKKQTEEIRENDCELASETAVYRERERETVSERERESGR